MKIKLIIKLFSLATALALASYSQASTPTVEATAIAAAAKPAAKAKTKPYRRYSKATLSAFQPAAAAPKKRAATSASPVMRQNTSASLHRPTGEAPKAAVSFADDTTLMASPERLNTETSSDFLTELSSDTGTFGDESVSVIDRFSDKPKAQAVVSGPLRLRVQNQGLRASVQIPLRLK